MQLAKTVETSIGTVSICELNVGELRQLMVDFSPHGEFGNLKEVPPHQLVGDYLDRFLTKVKCVSLPEGHTIDDVTLSEAMKIVEIWKELHWDFFRLAGMAPQMSK